jgi:hypothetical protein
MEEDWKEADVRERQGSSCFMVLVVMARDVCIFTSQCWSPGCDTVPQCSQVTTGEWNKGHSSLQ